MATRALKTVEQELDAMDAWRPALLAFYKADCWFQSTWNLERGLPLTAQDRRLIGVLMKVGERMPK